MLLRSNKDFFSFFFLTQGFLDNLALEGLFIRLAALLSMVLSINPARPPGNCYIDQRLFLFLLQNDRVVLLSLDIFPP